VIWENKTMLLFVTLLSGFGCQLGVAGEIFKAERIVSEVPKAPTEHKIGEESFSPLVIVRQEERGRTIDDPSTASYSVYDPNRPEKGLTRIFTGPGNEQYLRALTPHHNGWALSEIRLDPKKDPDMEAKWAWIHYPKGIIGPDVKERFWESEFKDNCLFGEVNISKNDTERKTRLVKYSPKEGVMDKSKMIFSHTEQTSSTEILGIAEVNGEKRIVLFDLDRFEYRDLGHPPPNYESDRLRFIRMRLALAGKDGVFMSSWKDEGFALSFLPNGGKWVEVISKVNIRKTFGGNPSWLPVEYLGRGNFAVSKTTIDTVPVPNEWAEDRKMFGAAQGVTMKIEGISGKILQESKPFIYDHNPPLEIPKNWWQDGHVRAVSFWEQRLKKLPSLFKWDEKSRELSAANDSKITLKKNEEYRDSQDGQYAIVFRKWTKKKGSKKARQTLKIINGTDGEIQKIKIESDFAEVLTDAYWISSEKG